MDELKNLGLEEMTQTEEREANGGLLYPWEDENILEDNRPMWQKMTV